MDFILVVQIPEVSISYDQVIEMEDILIEHLNDLGEVDGHDIGSGEVNIFIQTSRVMECYSRIVEQLSDKWGTVIRIAYRQIDGDEYHILFPQSLETFEVK